MKKFYGCPVCHARHSTEAWTYKTRKELGLDNLDELDIVHMNEINNILDSKNTFYCPSCETASLAKDIYNYEHETVKQLKVKLKNVFINLQMNPEMTVYININLQMNAEMTAYVKESKEEPEDAYKIIYQEGEWLISTPELEADWEYFSDMDEATDYLLQNLITNFYAKYS